MFINTDATGGYGSGYPVSKYRVYLIHGADFQPSYSAFCQAHQWQFHRCICDGSFVYHYVDGKFFRKTASQGVDNTGFEIGTINSSDSYRGNIADFRIVTGNGVDKIIVDQTRPTAADFGSITIGSIGVADNIDVYSRATDGYWNISTQSININFSLDDTDLSLINGYVTFEGEIDNVRDTLGYTYPHQSLNSQYKITSDDLEEEGMTINFPDYLPYEETNPEPYRNIAGIRELFNFADEKVIFFWITITDCAGNKFVHQLNTASLIVDLVPPEIQIITSTSVNDWYMEDETVNIQIQSPSSDIVVDLGTTIILNTGSSNGVAELSGDGSAARNHDFTYTILEGHTSETNTCLLYTSQSTRD